MFLVNEVFPKDGVDYESKSCSCHRILREVCGSDGETYPNGCVADCQGVSWKDGKCPAEEKSESCPCTRNIQYVCGSDGKTYANGCEADCQGVSWRDGECPGGEDFEEDTIPPDIFDEPINGKSLGIIL